MTPEKKFENEIIAELKKRGWFAHHFDANGVDGWPDILALKDNKFRLIEVKAGTKLRPEQVAFQTVFSKKYNGVIYVLEKGDKGITVTTSYNLWLPFNGHYHTSASEAVEVFL